MINLTVVLTTKTNYLDETQFVLNIITNKLNLKMLVKPTDNAFKCTFRIQRNEKNIYFLEKRPREYSLC